MSNPNVTLDASQAPSEEAERKGGPVADPSTGPDHAQKGPSPLSDLAVNIQGTLARDLIKTGELEKRASVMGLGMGGGLEAWKRMTMGIIWDTDGLKEEEDEEEEEGLDPEEVEARKAKARAAAMAKLMGDSSVSSTVPATIAEEDEECDEPKSVQSTTS